MARITSFEPIVGKAPRILILGSMPSVKSLQVQEYYGHGRNQFWRIMGDLFSFKDKASYAVRKSMVEDKGIAIWDVLASCERQGSLDANIKAPVHHDILGFVASHSSLRAIVFNGGKARQLYERAFRDQITGIDFIALGSTSPAYTLAYEKKLSEWQIILNYLGDD